MPPRTRRLCQRQARTKGSLLFRSNKGVFSTPIQASSLTMLNLLNLTHTTLRDKILGLLRDQRHQEQATRQADHPVTAE